MPQNRSAAGFAGSEPSKSARKREASARQDLGVELAQLPPQDIEALGLPEGLVTAFADLRKISSHGAQLRQRQYIGKLMRHIDPEPIRAALAEKKRAHDREVALFREIERWRAELILDTQDPADGSGALERFRREFPAADSDLIRALCIRTASDREQARAPRAARELFAYLRDLIAAPI